MVIHSYWVIEHAIEVFCPPYQKTSLSVRSVLRSLNCKMFFFSVKRAKIISALNLTRKSSLRALQRVIELLYEWHGITDVKHILDMLPNYTNG